MLQAFVDQGSAAVATLSRRLARAVDAFFFTPASARPLGALRIGLAAVLILQAWMLRAEVLEFFARDGIVQGGVARYFNVPGTPRLTWLIDRLSPLGVSEAACVYAVCGAYLASLFLLAAGLFTRFAAALAWFLHWTLMSASYTSIYGVDQYAHIFLFYLIWVPSMNAYSLDVALRRASPAPTAAARLGLRVMQLHMCVSYLASSIEKSSCPDWWNGELLWGVFSSPRYQQFDMSWLASWPRLSQLGGWAALAIEAGYCVFIWPRRTRKIWLLATLGLHLGIAIFMGLHLFGAIMCVLNLALFGVSPEPRGRLFAPAPSTTGAAGAKSFAPGAPQR